MSKHDDLIWPEAGMYDNHQPDGVPVELSDVKDVSLLGRVADAREYSLIRSRDGQVEAVWLEARDVEITSGDSANAGLIVAAGVSRQADNAQVDGSVELDSLIWQEMERREASAVARLESVLVRIRAVLDVWQTEVARSASTDEAASQEADQVYAQIVVALAMDADVGGIDLPGRQHIDLLASTRSGLRVLIGEAREAARLAVVASHVLALATFAYGRPAAIIPTFDIEAEELPSAVEIMKPALDYLIGTKRQDGRTKEESAHAAIQTLSPEARAAAALALSVPKGSVVSDATKAVVRYVKSQKVLGAGRRKVNASWPYVEAVMDAAARLVGVEWTMTGKKMSERIGIEG